MSRESILKIRETEETAARMVETARARAQEMIAAAEEEGREMLNRTEVETKQSLEEMLSQLKMRTESANQRSAAEAKLEAAELRRNVSLRRKIAEKIIIRGIERKCR